MILQRLVCVQNIKWEISKIREKTGTIKDRYRDRGLSSGRGGGWKKKMKDLLMALGLSALRQSEEISGKAMGKSAVFMWIDFSNLFWKKNINFVKEALPSMKWFVSHQASLENYNEKVKN